MGSVRAIAPILTAQFAARCEQAPHQLALQIGDDSYTYGQLWRAATALAAQLRARGVGRGDRVCLLLEKSFDLYAAVWGVWLAGAAYVPLAPAYPAARLRLIIERAQPSLVWFASQESWDRIGAPGGVAAEPIAYHESAPAPAPPTVDPADLAYILFTSGSTGTPKGVMVTHGNVAAFVAWAQHYFAVSPGDRLSGHSDLTFDLSVFDTFVAHCSGSCLVPVIAPFDRSTPGAFIRAQRISIWFSVPSVLSAMTTLGDATAANLDGLRWMAFCGEALLPAPIRQVMRAVPHLRVANLYGPTEATVACAAHELTAPPDEHDDGVPFGWRTAGTEVFVWTEESRVAVAGERGEV